MELGVQRAATMAMRWRCGGDGDRDSDGHSRVNILNLHDHP
eukprot:CAMPEP_0185273910 /NCGR_PEP_ID=MMETSP1359-20130426/50616_1 /TAXON_ID=552665 /ORGANISM="Bigelowiella longifila, Strain CCMP242" /LENGTH=40 /DNA_ID= /DNA_START= /DNA_END= /DNA_ORIENTATION=